MFADYECSARTTLDAGEIRVVRWLSAAGALSSTVVLWTPGVPANPGLIVSGRWQALAPASVDFGRGLAMFDWTVSNDPRRRRTSRYRLELRVRPGPPWEGYGVLEGRFPLSDGVRLSADWADVAAMARGAGRLSLVLKDRKGRVLSATALDRSAFEGFEPEAERLLARTAEMAGDFRTRCESTRTDDIII